MELGVFLLIGAAILAIGIVAFYLERLRRQKLAELAESMGFEYRPGRDRTRLGGRFDHINLLQNGSNRYTHQHLVGQVSGHPVVACDYHYETYSTDSKGRRRTHHHHHGVIFVEIPLIMSEVRIRRENFLDRIAAAVGFSDINFESAEFSRRFHVTANNRKFAYDLIHTRAMEYLLDKPAYSWEFEGNAIALYKSGTFRPEEIRPAIEMATGFVPLIPEYVWAERGTARTGRAEHV